MKVLYFTFRDDLTNPDTRGSNYHFYKAVQELAEQVEVVGPFEPRDMRLERLAKRVYRRITRRNYLKYSISDAIVTSTALKRACARFKPDIIFTTTFSPLVFFNGHIPCIYRVDTTFMGFAEDSAISLYGWLPLTLSIWQEKRAFRRCTKVITHSTWSKDILMNYYKLEDERVAMFANPAALPEHIIPKHIDVETVKRLEFPIRLLLVAKDPQLKGIDVAGEVVRELNAQGIPASLTVCGGEGPETPYTSFVGPYRHKDPEELMQLVRLYQQAHFFIYPTYFDASPRVTSEAAAFAVPSITNNIGGVATSVKDGVSGVVLPRRSRAEAYIAAIADLVSNQEKYYELCRKTRQRYDEELNWRSAGKTLFTVFTSVLAERTSRIA